jgi:hypothetical protein
VDFPDLQVIPGLQRVAKVRKDQEDQKDLGVNEAIKDKGGLAVIVDL